MNPRYASGRLPAWAVCSCFAVLSACASNDAITRDAGASDSALADGSPLADAVSTLDGPSYDASTTADTGTAQDSGNPADASSGEGGSGMNAPGPAQTVGYTTLTFDSTTIGTTAGTWLSDNWLGNTEPSGAVAQNADGSIGISGHSGNGYNADLVTCAYDASRPDLFRGIAFGGGFYAEATFSFTGTPDGNVATPAFWANDVEHMVWYQGGTPAGLTSVQWQGQPAGYGHWGEIDVIEANVAGGTGYGGAFHDWYGTMGNEMGVSGEVGSPFSIGSASFSSSNKFAVLWIPATATTQGHLKYFFNRAQVGTTLSWNPFDPASPPPAQNGTTVGSVIDVRHWMLILGDSQPNTPMTVTSVQVWQGPGADNITQ